MTRASKTHASKLTAPESFRKLILLRIREHSCRRARRTRNNSLVATIAERPLWRTRRYDRLWPIAAPMLSHARRNRRRRGALLKDHTLQLLVADLVAARTAAGMTQSDVAHRMWTTKSAVSRLESGRYARPTLDTIEKYALAVGARVLIRVRGS